MTVLFSTLSNSNTGVLAGTGCTVLVSYLIGLIPKAKEYLPTSAAPLFSQQEGVILVPVGQMRRNDN